MLNNTRHLLHNESEEYQDYDAWNTAINSVIFSMSDLIKVIKKHNYQNRAPYVIWDDAGVFGGSMLYLYNLDNAMILKALMDTVGTRVRLLMLTCPNIEGLMKFLRKYGDFIIDVNIRGGSGCRTAFVYRPYRAKGFAQKWKKAWADEFDVRIPNEVYEKYTAKRDKYASVILKELMKRGKKGKDILRANDLLPASEGAEGDELVRQDRLLEDVDGPDLSGDTTSDRGT